MNTQRTAGWALSGLLAIVCGCNASAPAPEPKPVAATPSTASPVHDAPPPAVAPTAHEARRPPLVSNDAEAQSKAQGAPAPPPTVHEARRPKLAPTAAARGAERSEGDQKGPTGDDEWTVSIEPNATLIVRHRGVPIVTAVYVFWSKGWGWVDSSIRAEPGRDGQTTIVGEIPALGISVRGASRKLAPGAIQLEYQLQAKEPLSSIIGGGLQWNLELGSPSLEGTAGDPVLLDNQSGWAWPVGPGQKIEARFDQPLPESYFERNQKSTARTFLIGDHVEPGNRQIRLTLELPREGRIVPSAVERYGPADTARWYRGALAWNAAPVDLSFLNANDRPAGRRGPVHADGDRLVFADGSEARFWGANLAAGALFGAPRENIAPQAHRLAQLGYNLVRIHHHDSWSSVFGPNPKDTRHFDPDAMDRLDWWIKCLKDEGIYIWLDMHVLRTILPADGLRFGAEEVQRARGDLKGFCYYNDELQGLMKEFQGNYLNHLNKYTKKQYKDDPAVVGVLVTNEDDLTVHYGNMFLPDKNFPTHAAVFARDVQKFASAHGLPAASVGQTWVPGPAKTYLNDAQHRFDRAMIEDLRSLGLKAPIATTSLWGALFSFSLPAVAAGDIVDVHSYGPSEALSTNPRYEPNFVTDIVLGQVAGKPVAISEWNARGSVREVDRFTAPLYVASIASLQGWDAPMLYNYSQRPLENVAGTGDDTWSSFADPALSGAMPAAAVAFRKGHVRPARDHYYLDLDVKQLLGQNTNAKTSATLRTLAETSRLSIGIPAVKELPWLKPTEAPSGAKILTDLDRDFIPAGQTFVRSDTGEVTRDWKAGTLTIDTPKTQAVSGWIGGKTFELADATFQFQTKKAVVALTSIDDEPLARSRFIMITALARAMPDDKKQLPYLSEPVAGTVRLRNQTEGLELLALDADGSVAERNKLTAGPDGLTVRLPTHLGTHWYVLKAPKNARKK